MSKQVFTVASLEAKEGSFETLKQIIGELAIATRTEAGNIEYSIIEDPSKPNTLFSIEKWESREAESKHWEMPHLKEALTRVGDLLAKEPVMHIDKGTQSF